MEFSRIGENTIRCVITEDEIIDLGYTIEEILGNTERTQEFMNQIFDMAEAQFNLKFDMGLRTVRADFLPNHTVSLTFSENKTQQKVNGFMEHLMEYVNSMLDVSKEKLEELKAKAQIEKAVAEGKEPKVIILLKFDTMDVLLRYTKNIGLEPLPDSTLYKYADQYFLKLDLSGYSEEEVLSLSVLTDEYANGLMVGVDRLAFMKEHGDVIIENAAIENLREL